jgi:uncharacterized protein YggE
MKTWKLLAAAALVAGGSTMVALAAAKDDAERAGATVPDDSVPGGDDAATADRRTVTVTGHGTVKVTPDIAMISAGVQTTADTAQEAMDTIGTKSQALVDTLKAVGVAEEDIQTSGLSLWPAYGNDGRQITGYQGSVSVTITARDIDRIGETLDALQGFVGEELTLGGISFSYADPEAVLGEARAAAIENARVRAGQFAEAAGAELGEIRHIAETSSGGMIPLPAAREMAAADAASIAIEPGSQELAVDVSVVFEMS